MTEMMRCDRCGLTIAKWRTKIAAGTSSDGWWSNAIRNERYDHCPECTAWLVAAATTAMIVRDEEPA